MSDEIVFSAKVGPWICIKKQKIEQDIKNVEVSRTLASIHESMDRKIWEFLKQDFDLESLDRIAYEITGAVFDEKKKEWFLKGRISEQQITEALTKLRSPSTTKKITEQTKSGKEIAKAYLTRKVLELLGFNIELNPKTVDKYLEEKQKLGAMG